MTTKINTYLALDVGTARIGLALANSIARIASPLPALTNDDQWFEQLEQLLNENDIDTLVVGRPRNLSGDDTAQTAYVHSFCADLSARTSIPVVLQDEAVTSVQAEAELTRRGRPYTKGDIDSLSAVYILQDYLQEHES